MGQGTVGVVLAGGKGTRFTGDTPKQFVSLGGQPVLCHSVAAMERCDAVDAICLVVASEAIDTVRALLEPYHFRKITAIVPGGAQRADSTKAALSACDSAAFSNILLHDAARPLLTEDVLCRLVKALETDEAVTAAIPVTDTIARADNANGLLETPDRSLLWQVQTPQGFHLDTLKQAYQIAEAANTPGFTDDCGVVRYAFPNLAIRLVPGSRRLMKLTYPEDLALLTALL